MHPKVTQLLTKFPKLFTDKTRVEFPEGWYDLVSSACTDVKKYNVRIDQIKQKFGQLRVYVNHEDLLKKPEDTQANIWAMCQTYSEKSETICEVCSNVGELCTKDSGYRRTLCVECR